MPITESSYLNHTNYENTSPWATVGQVGLGLLLWTQISTTLLSIGSKNTTSLNPMQCAALILGTILTLSVMINLIRTVSPAYRNWQRIAASATSLTLVGSTTQLWFLHHPVLLPGFMPMIGTLSSLTALTSLYALQKTLAPSQNELALLSHCMHTLAGGAGLLLAMMSQYAATPLAGTNASILILLGTVTAILLLKQQLQDATTKQTPDIKHVIVLSLLLGPPLLLWIYGHFNEPSRQNWWLTAAAMIISHTLHWQVTKNPRQPGSR
ncbi:hypothetical protein LPH44_05500 [Xylella taiwanensis]|uniref:Uncharacterized protein n=2 Tax=Xylella taiwanensis TaxID=1444770 RepID=A0ABS8TXA2_9GAMM|nr:hypothetical protein [Xylella taiwanensis]MCD8470763.1 hypothetical protein [Xylella taiwanensis]MCD8473833.1 hypothetical protein [Xylella taiwanensis]UFN02205.1 hypothetical protein LPH43_11245 [Xylella taiwanensis]UFN06676.1 hypothetical protein LPH42_11050 [Xylella taiwanensis]UFN12275.1 hypothetical protein LPH44_05500 [Xylella taiwanensis]